MGNCVFRGFAQSADVIKVVTANGGVMELHPPITAECITNSFPGHGIFHSRDFLSPHPLVHSDELLAGEHYYLLPLTTSRPRRAALAPAAPYRMSFDSNGGAWRRAAEPADGGAVWKVKLMISPEQLTEILSTETRTEALIESVRTVAKCGSGFASAANSDQWSVASSWRGGEKVAS